MPHLHAGGLTFLIIVVAATWSLLWAWCSAGHFPCSPRCFCRILALLPSRVARLQEGLEDWSIWTIFVTSVQNYMELFMPHFFIELVRKFHPVSREEDVINPWYRSGKILDIEEQPSLENQTSTLGHFMIYPQYFWQNKLFSPQ